MAALAGAAGPELRGVWVPRVAEMDSREGIASLLDRAKGANLNCVFVNVWSRGYPLWRSEVFHRETGQWTDPVFGDRDVLGEFVEEARQRGIAVVAWAEYGFVAGYTGNRPEGSKGPILDAHPDWIARSKSGEVQFSWADPFKSYWLSHNHPEAKEFLFQLMAELAEKYSLDGVQFDRARYPQLDCGYDDATKALYAAEHDGGAPPSNERDPEWMRWRAEKLDQFVAELTRRIKARNWRMLVTNAPIKFDYSYVNFLQRYPEWWKQGALDYVSPQLYVPATFERDLAQQAASLPATDRLVPGINLANRDVDELVRTIESVRAKGLPGVVIWSWVALSDPGLKALERLAETVYAEPAQVPWR
jgi:uncharacterized lipoprotein YddW (UPF0748 family)